MTQLVEGKDYIVTTSGAVSNLFIDAGGAAALECSVDGGNTFNAVGSLPAAAGLFSAAGGELQAGVQLNNCLIRVTGVTGNVHFKPDVKEA